MILLLYTAAYLRLGATTEAGCHIGHHRLGILFDTSTSLSDDDRIAEAELVNKLVTDYDAETSRYTGAKPRLYVGAFSKCAYRIYLPRTPFELRTVTRSVKERAHRPGGYTCTMDGILDAEQQVSRMYGDTRQKILVILTDGVPVCERTDYCKVDPGTLYTSSVGHRSTVNNIDYVQHYVRKMKREGFMVIVYAFGRGAKIEELKKMASSSAHFATQESLDVTAASEFIQARLCNEDPDSVTDPIEGTTTPTPSTTTSMQQTTTATTPTPTTTPPSCYLTDHRVGILFDTSTSVSDEERTAEAQLVNDLVTEYHTHTSLHQSSKPRLYVGAFAKCAYRVYVPHDPFELNTVTQDVEQRAMSPGGYTCTMDGILDAEKQVNSMQEDPRKKILVILTDGVPNCKRQDYCDVNPDTLYTSDTGGRLAANNIDYVQTYVQKMKNEGYTVIVYAFGSSPNIGELEKMASSSAHFASQEVLDPAVALQFILERVCNEDPDTVTKPTTTTASSCSGGGTCEDDDKIYTMTEYYDQAFCDSCRWASQTVYVTCDASLEINPALQKNTPYMFHDDHTQQSFACYDCMYHAWLERFGQSIHTLTINLTLPPNVDLVTDGGTPGVLEAGMYTYFDVEKEKMYGCLKVNLGDAVNYALRG